MPNIIPKLEYNLEDQLMSNFRFFHPIEVRYGDLDPQGHLNNAKYLTYLEQARISYVHKLGLWSGGSFLELGIILADIQITFLKPVLFGQPVRVGVRVSRLGNKSLTMEHEIQHGEDGTVFATSKCVLVAYDYQSEQTVTIPNDWRQIIQNFEGLNG